MTEFDKNQLIFNINCIKKPPKEFFFRGLVNLCIRCPQLSLAELRCTTSAFETVFLSLFHTRVSG